MNTGWTTDLGQSRGRSKFGIAIAAALLIGFGGAWMLSDAGLERWLFDGAASGVIPNMSVAPETVVDRKFSRCVGGPRVNCVVDGDTIWLGGRKIRIADMDTPEVYSPSCSSEAALGAQATLRLTQLLNAGPFEVRTAGSRDSDKYGRDLRVFTRDGTSLGDILVSEGLAHPWRGRRESWCG
ncbi:thermonuclease family protein [Devosia rhodophyticola]|uniref:Thermonuclease family protein n=1 Tax=Devosia rhodophyticola TaxID=3026423 RepID=A0ABY7YVL4_9HYPH|nr:thermonuclease family protein [Devosia rhodophyticola]WDR05354.1 thermonuclease family protein [Devosia rhodophyticola]